MTMPLALDTSAAVPLFVRSHPAHAEIARWRAGRPVVLCGHALIETYSVLTRLPGDARLAPDQARRVLTEGLGPPLILSTRVTRRLPMLLAEKRIAGGAVYDALVALAAVEHHHLLVTRDARAMATYELFAAIVEIIG